MSRVLCFAAGLTMLAVGLSAQTQSKAAIDAPKTYPLHLKTVSQIPKGKIALIEGIADSSGDHFAQEDLGILQPVAVTLLARDQAADVTLQLLKDRWDTPHRSGSTKGTGQQAFRVRTQGEMKIMITAPQPTPYLLAVWVGSDIKLPMKAAFVPMAEYRKRHPEAGAMGGSGMTWALAAVAGAIVLLAVVLFAKKRPRGAAVLLVCGLGLTGVRISAQAPHDTTIDQFISTQNLGGVKAGGIGALAGNIANDGQALMDAFSRLTPGDSEYDPDYSPPGAPDVPSSCAGSDACGDCYSKAQNDINFMRFNLEKLRSTCRGGQDVADRAIKFGDDVSSIHGALGLAWQSEKVGILKTVKHLKETCKSKYDGMMTGTEKAIREMDHCEAEFFNNRDWYDRYGFLYYQFLRARYEPEK